VLRYSALLFGVFYGITHQRSITATQKSQAAKRDYEHKQKLIEQAKAEYAKKKNPVAATTSDNGRMFPFYPATPNRLEIMERRTDRATVAQDPMGPNFDLEKYFEALMAQKA